LAPPAIVPGALLSTTAHQVLSTELTETTIRAAIRVAALNRVADELVPASIALLVEHTLNAGSLAHSKFAAAIALSVGLALGGFVLGVVTLARQAAPERRDAAEAPAIKVGPKANVTTEQGSTDAWSRTDKFEPPDFERYFPDDAEGAKLLTTLWLANDREERSDA
jgi:hypothetical protein